MVRPNIRNFSRGLSFGLTLLQPWCTVGFCRGATSAVTVRRRRSSRPRRPERFVIFLIHGGYQSLRCIVARIVKKEPSNMTSHLIPPMIAQHTSHFQSSESGQEKPSGCHSTPDTPRHSSSQFCFSLRDEPILIRSGRPSAASRVLVPHRALDGQGWSHGARRHWAARAPAPGGARPP